MLLNPFLAISQKRIFRATRRTVLDPVCRPTQKSRVDSIVLGANGFTVNERLIKDCAVDRSLKDPTYIHSSILPSQRLNDALLNLSFLRIKAPIVGISIQNKSPTRSRWSRVCGEGIATKTSLPETGCSIIWFHMLKSSFRAPLLESDWIVGKVLLQAR